ncbi:MAG TPA: hypothetical protein VMP12_09665 [Candidatus Sulfotelmatobacter sp.]|nr:hypothetical protein [Candidatus Sulfotelmatobacter sp.]
MNSAPSRRVRALLPTIFLALLFAVPRAHPQAPLEPAQLPVRTTFYVVWRGAPAGDIRHANNLFALWDDPEFAPVRAAMFDNLTAPSGDNKSQTTPGLTPEETQEFSALLENGFVLGYLGKPDSKMTASATPPKPPAAGAPGEKWNGLFFLYNRAGKEALLSKAVLRIRNQEKELPQLSQTTIAGIPALKVQRKTETTYWIEHGKYAASANDPAVLEQLLPRLEGATPPDSLAQSATFQEAQSNLGGVLELFAAIPALKNDAQGTANGFYLPAVLTAIKLDAVRSICGRVVLDGAKTRFQGTILGDTAPGSLLDLWPEGADSPPSLAIMPPSAISYSESQFDLPAFYQVLKRGIAAMSPNGQNPAMMVEMMAQAKLGMPLADALALPSGEFTSMQLSPALDPDKSIYVFGIHKKAETLKLLRTLLGEQITSERAEGDTTFLKISLSGKQGAKGVAQWNFYHLGVTPNFIYGAPKFESVKEAIAGRDTMHTMVLTPLQTARADYPAKINGLYFFDFQKVDWAAAKVRWIEEAKKSAEKPTATAQQKAAAAKVPHILADANPQTLQRHLHTMAGASWKDEKGIHFDQWLQ